MMTTASGPTAVYSLSSPEYMMATGTTISDIPYEVLLYIFTIASLSAFSGPPRWRTSTGKIPRNPVHNPIIDRSTSYHPFSTKPFSVRSEEWARTVQESLNTRRTIVLVCKEWWKLGTELLYEAIRIDHASMALFNALNPADEESEPVSHGTNKFDLAKLVKRAEICADMVDIDPFNPSLAWRILRSCPNITTVVIPDLRGISLGRARWADENEAFELNGPSTAPAFPNITTIECHIPLTAGPNTRALKGVNRVQHNLNGFLEQLLDHSPNVERITLTGGRWMNTPFTPQQPEPKLFAFSFLTTLRVEAQVEALLQAEPELILQLPKLRHLIIGGALGAAGPVLMSCGPQIAALEVLDLPIDASSRWRQPTIRPRVWTVSNVLEKCLNIQELNFPLSLGETILLGLKQASTGPPNPGKCALPDLQRIRIHWTMNGPENTASTEKFMANIGQFFANHLEAKFMSEVVLSGHGGQDHAWKWQPLIQRIKDCGRKFERVCIIMQPM
ncbi:hypothetical protein CVT24_006734 [Panaeolus cyanescens]|uniref:Uncharacterized protein n=1 Tax=Panaeolus cyanescens TaxID=181874 RepID=A0A409VDS6_9AGAR|nr:hypothetical protein CVT24_006734 [Panaeolus cyanescens]